MSGCFAPSRQLRCRHVSVLFDAACHIAYTAIYHGRVCYEVDMYVARIPNRGSPPAILLRESYREGGKVKNRTLANLSHWPEHKVDALSRERSKGCRRSGICPRRLRSPAACRTGMSRRCWAPRRRLGLRGADRCHALAQTRSGVRDADRAGDRPRLQAGDRARVAHRDRHQLTGPGASGSAAAMRTTCMRRWTGRWPARRPSKTPWPHGI